MVQSSAAIRASTPPVRFTTRPTMCTYAPTYIADMEITNDYMTSALKTPSFMLEAAIALFESVLRSREHGYVSRRTREHVAQSRKRAELALPLPKQHGPQQPRDDAGAGTGRRSPRHLLKTLPLRRKTRHHRRPRWST